MRCWFSFYMRKHLFLIISFVSISTFVSAQSGDKLQLSVGTGYQKENFHWSIAGNADGQNPNVYSELKWHNIAGETWYSSLQYNFWNRFWITGGYSYSKITSGTSNDTDYGADNRTDSVYDQNFSSNKGSTSTWSADIGCSVIQTRKIQLLPSIGYSSNYQNYYLLGNVGDFAQVNSSYKTNWKGTYLKLKVRFQLIGPLCIAASATYNQIKYNAAADWNLIENFQHPVSFRDNANGYGFNGNAGLLYAITKHISIHAGLTWFDWETGKGIDQLYLTNGTTDKTQMNGASRKGTMVDGGLDIRF